MPKMAEMLKRRFAGPPGQGETDARLSALKSNQQAAEEEANAAADESPSLVKDLAPLLAAQVSDLVSTNQLTSMNGRMNTEGWPMQTWEGNPLPGMQSDVGRIGWGALESLIVAALLKANRGVGKAAVKALVPVHSTLAVGNTQQAKDALFEHSRLVGPDMTDVWKRGR